MKQTENSKKAFCKIHDGLLLGIGGLLPQLLAVFAGAWFGVLVGGKPLVVIMENVVKNQELKQDSIMTMLDTLSYIVNSKKDFDTAGKYELKGFHSLVDENYGEAIWNFMKSENSANGYHASYEISKYLKDNSSSVSEPDFWTKTYKYVTKNYWGFIPPEILTEMRKKINSQK